MDAVALRRPAFLALLALALGGCPLPPPPASDALRSEALPNTQVPEQWAAGPGAVVGDVTDGWLLLFEDAALAQLVAEAMTYNTDLAVAAARVEAAGASARAAGSLLLPQISIAGRGGGKMSGDNSGLQGLGLFANWELDLWGRVRAQRHAAEAQYESAALDAHYARESIAALVAKSWFLAREAAIQRDIAAEMVESSQALAEFSRERLRVGKGDELEVAEAETSVFTYSDVMVQAEIARQNALRSIEILAGRYPGAKVDVGRDLPPVPGAIPAGLPSQLLERRPDVRAAERRVAAAFYLTKEAQAARLPRIALTAGVSSVSSDLIVLKARDNPMWSVGATLTAPLFTGGALQAQVEARTAEQKAAVADYGRIGARAFSEVEGALSTAFQLERRADILARAVKANERAVNFARVRYDVGSGDLRAVRQQMLSLHAARTSLVRAQAESLVQRVNLHLALGGGFEPANQ